MIKCAVFGSPISHSLSPKVHKYFADQCGLNVEYVAIDPKNFEEDIKIFFLDGGKGCNVTLPYKVRAYNMSDEVDDISSMSQACNTLSRIDEARIQGNNTDGIGLVADLHQHYGAMLNKKILLLGAGGAAKGVLPLLIKEGAHIVVSNRTFERAQELVVRFQDHIKQGLLQTSRPENIRACSLKDLDKEEDFDIIINATSAAIDADRFFLPHHVISKHGFCYDMMYGKQTAFMEWAKALKVASIDGLGMLVGQAAESFYLWHGQRVDIMNVIRDIRTCDKNDIL